MMLMPAQKMTKLRLSYTLYIKGYAHTCGAKSNMTSVNLADNANCCVGLHRTC